MCSLFHWLKGPEFSGICTENQWKRVFSHNVAHGVFRDTEDVKLKNPYDPSAPLFSFLDNLAMLKRREDPYHLKLCYPELSEEHEFPCNEWIQMEHPLKSSSADNMEEAIAITFNRNGVNNYKFKGLGLNRAGKNTKTIIDGSPTNNNWWLAIGALKTKDHDDARIPGPQFEWVSKVELYMKRSQPSKIGDPKETPTYMHCIVFIDMISGVREKRHVLEQMQLSFEFQDLYDFVDRETRDASETQEEIEMRSYGSHLRFEEVS